MPARPPWIDHFGENFLWSNASLIIKGMAPYGVVALEEIDRVCERLKSSKSTNERPLKKERSTSQKLRSTRGLALGSPRTARGRYS